MGLFNKNNKDDEYLTVLGEIRDNLKFGINEDRFDEVIRNFEVKLVDFKHNNDDEIEALTDKVNKLAKITELQSQQLDENYQLIQKQETQITILTNAVKKQLNLIQDLNKDETITFDELPSKPTKKDEDVIVAYGKKWKLRGQVHLENIMGLSNDGKFITKTRSLTWDINTLLRLKKCMKQNEKYPTASKLAKAVGVNATNVIELGYYILNGDFDKYFNEWEQIQADNTFKKYGNWKPNIENNPEKRKEKGYV